MWPYALILLAFVADRLTKAWATDYLALHGTVEITPWLSLRPVYNEGIAFGMFPGIGMAMGWLSILIVIGLFVYLVRLPRSLWLMRLGLPLIIGGALGNLVDRVLVGQVFDFIQTPLRPGIFNIADVMINLGVVLCLVGAFWQGKREKDSAIQGDGAGDEQSASG
jgi:signal peptidase II